MEPVSGPPVYPTPVNQRPSFLTILCILTFLSCAWGLFNAISSYSGADLAAQVGQDASEKAQDQVQDSEGGDFADRIIGSVSSVLTPERIRQSAIANLIYNLLTLAGAFLMWNLRKVGFYVYIAGVLVAIIAPFIVFGGLMGGLASAGTAFVSVIFVVLYALNLKYMR